MDWLLTTFQTLTVSRPSTIPRAINNAECVSIILLLHSVVSILFPLATEVITVVTTETKFTEKTRVIGSV